MPARAWALLTGFQGAELKPAWPWDWRPRVAGAPTVFAESGVFAPFQQTLAFYHSASGAGFPF